MVAKTFVFNGHYRVCIQVLLWIPLFNGILHSRAAMHSVFKDLYFSSTFKDI